MDSQIDSDQARRDQEEREKDPALPVIKSACRQKNERRHHDGAQNRRSDPTNVKLIHKINIIVGRRSRAGISFLPCQVSQTKKRPSLWDAWVESNHRICGASQGVRLVGMDANENLLASSDSSSD